MSKLQVIGNCYSDRDVEYAKELFKAIEDAGYTLGYNSESSVVVMKEVEDGEQENETEN